MITLPKKEASEVWERFWNEAQEEFFKVESLQEYKEEDNSSLEEWLRGNREKSAEVMTSEDSYIQEWVKKLRLKEGFRKIRVHIIEKPLTPYLEWEIAHYKNISIPLAGEEVWLVEKSDVPDYELGDFMMFDERRVTDSMYSEEGELLSMDIYDEGEDISKFTEAKEYLLKKAYRLED